MIKKIKSFLKRINGVSTPLVGVSWENQNKSERDEKPKRIGILNKGKKNKFIDSTFENLDIGIQDEGEETIAKGNKFK
jgi:hypothetical protein